MHAYLPQALYSGEGMKALSDGHASDRGAFDNIAMNGQEVFKFAVRAVPNVRRPPVTPFYLFFCQQACWLS